METTNVKKGNFVLNVLKERCPHCGEGQVFARTKFFQIPAMEEKCPVCQYKFDREPGYFLGAMYISYGIAVLTGLITFLVCHFAFPAMPTIWVPVAMIGAVFLIAKKNYKLSRLIYIHLFPW